MPRKPLCQWWPRPDSNRDLPCESADFKSAVSTVPPRGQRARVPAPLAHASRIYQTCATLSADFGALEATSLLQRMAPDAFPVLAAEIGDAAVALVEFVRDLEHREHQPALGRPGDMAAALLAPDEFAGLDLEPRRRPLLVHEL